MLLCLAPHQGQAQGAADAAEPGAEAELDAAVKTLVHDRGLREASVSVSIVDVDSGRTLGSHQEHVPQNPASNQKLYTAACALATLRPDHRYVTTLSGTVRGSAAQGLVLRGHGDPSLDTADLYGMAAELKARGVRRVEGDLQVDQRAFDDQTTPAGFEQQPSEWASFRAPVSAVAVHENTVTLTVRPQEADAPALVAFDPPGFVDVEGSVLTTESGDAVTLLLSPNGRRLSAKVGGTAGRDARMLRYVRRVEDPQLLAGYAMRAVLEDLGIKVQGSVSLATGNARGAVLAKHASAPLGELVTQLGKQSDNFYAEMIFKSLAAEVKGKPAKGLDAAQVLSKCIEARGASDTGVSFKNGSGLFDSNRATAASLTALLRGAYRDAAISSEFVAQLAVGGVDGTLHRRFHDLRAHRAVRAKTGTLDDVIALSGYVLGPPGKGPVAFSVLINKVSGHGAQARAATETLVTQIHRRQWGKERTP
jgi:D-alanyl-D-alanine carboxypeptidase/D-alanyl-D-alanine-endopeptidase (penicillin-binding protein 4)